MKPDVVRGCSIAFLSILPLLHLDSCYCRCCSFARRECEKERRKHSAKHTISLSSLPLSSTRHERCFCFAVLLCRTPPGVWSSSGGGSSAFRSHPPSLMPMLSARSPAAASRFLRNGSLVLPHQLKRRREKDAVKQKRVISEGKSGGRDSCLSLDEPRRVYLCRSSASISARADQRMGEREPLAIGERRAMALAWC